VKRFKCTCGRRIFFDNTSCVSCGSPVGFDPERIEVLTLRPVSAARYVSTAGLEYRYCGNGIEHEVCNWLVPAGSGQRLCLGCRHTEMVPALDVGNNRLLWARLEAAKRRLLYSLLCLKLPLADASGEHTLTFRFLEDRRRNPAVLESFVTTGYLAGTVTINLAEADDAARHAAREQMQERYRTLLGHFRHESAHFYFTVLLVEQDETDQFRELFGDERSDYATAMQRYYAEGPVADWSYRHVSAYASAHPHEDWAESFAHYLHISDALETAEAAGMTFADSAARPHWISAWAELAVMLNEFNRGLGLDDPYPFLLTDVVVKKLEFIDRVVGNYT
jgi:hypothetical protein